MKILHLLYESSGDHFGIGGVGIRAYEIYAPLSPRHDITLLCKKYPGARDGVREGLRHLFVGVESRSFARTLLAYAREASRFVREEGRCFDVVIEDFSPAIPTFLFSYRARPVILQVQGYTGRAYFRKYQPGLSVPLYVYERWVPRLYRNFIFVSRASMARYRLGSGKTFRIISNGVGRDLLTLGPGESDYLLYLGRIDVYSKGLDLLLDAFATLRPAFPGVRLVIAGDGRDRAHFSRLFGLLPREVRAQIELSGWVEGEAKRSLLRDALLVVAPSRHETQGIVVLEAAAASKAVVVSDIDAFRPAVDAGAALAFRRGDSGELAAQIASLLRNPSSRHACGGRGRQWAGRFLWERIAMDFEAFVQDVAGRFRC